MRRFLSWVRRRRVMRHHYIEQRLRNYKARDRTGSLLFETVETPLPPAAPWGFDDVGER